MLQWKHAMQGNSTTVVGVVRNPPRVFIIVQFHAVAFHAYRLENKECPLTTIFYIEVLWG
jgi:hypothetical protein